LIGVAVGSSPTGPFTDIGAPLVGSKTTAPTVEAIDPHVFIDTDGQVYMYYGGSWGSNLGIQKLNSDMVSLSGTLSVVTPTNYTEGPFMSKRNGVYYMSYSNGNWSNDTYNVQYATSTSPMGPWTYKGQILSSDSGHKGPGHHAFVQVPSTDTWVIAYHYWDTSYSARHTSTDFITYNADGTIAPVVMTGGGIVRQWESFAVRGDYVRHQNGRGRIDPLASISPAADGQFFMVSGLATADPSAVAFESINFPNRYLRHRNGEIWLDDYDGSSLMNADATFYKRTGLATGSDRSFESYNYPGQYIRQRSQLLYREALSTSQDMSDGSFMMH
jgi:hypothetical protein